MSWRERGRNFFFIVPTIFGACGQVVIPRVELEHNPLPDRIEIIIPESLTTSETPLENIPKRENFVYDAVRDLPKERKFKNPIREETKKLD